MAARNAIRQRAAVLAEQGLDYVGPGPVAGTTWAYVTGTARAVVVDRSGARATSMPAAVRVAELVDAQRGRHVVVYRNGNHPEGIRVELPEHLHGRRDRHGRLSRELGDEIHPAGACTSWIPFDARIASSVAHVQATPGRPLVVVNASETFVPAETFIAASYPGTCGLCWGRYRAGDSIALAHRDGFGPVHASCAQRADGLPVTEPAEPVGAN